MSFPLTRAESHLKSTQGWSWPRFRVKSLDGYWLFTPVILFQTWDLPGFMDSASRWRRPVKGTHSSEKFVRSSWRNICRQSFQPLLSVSLPGSWKILFESSHLEYKGEKSRNWLICFDRSRKTEVENRRKATRELDIYSPPKFCHPRSFCLSIIAEEIGEVAFPWIIFAGHIDVLPVELAWHLLKKRVHDVDWCDFGQSSIVFASPPNIFDSTPIFVDHSNGKCQIVPIDEIQIWSR